MERRIDRLTRQVRGVQVSVAVLVAGLAVVAFVSFGRTPSTNGVPPQAVGAPLEHSVEGQASAVPGNGSAK
jgi:hypothetical protein